jgi:hypothetical protein
MTNASALIPENYDALKDAYIESAQELESLRRQVEFFRKHFFGTKSERSHLSPSDQTSLLEAVRISAEPAPCFGVNRQVISVSGGLLLGA